MTRREQRRLWTREIELPVTPESMRDHSTLGEELRRDNINRRRLAFRDAIISVLAVAMLLVLAAAGFFHLTNGQSAYPQPGDCNGWIQKS